MTNYEEISKRKEVQLEVQSPLSFARHLDGMILHDTPSSPLKKIRIKGQFYVVIKEHHKGEQWWHVFRKTQFRVECHRRLYRHVVSLPARNAAIATDELKADFSFVKKMLDAGLAEDIKV